MFLSKQGIILLGHPRSGTTLTRRLLNGHSRIASPPESHLLSACARFLDSERSSNGVDIGVLAGLGFSGVSDEKVLEKLKEFAFSFLDEYAEREGKVRWAEKTAFDAFHIENIEKFCGDQALFVGIVRHPLDVAVSSIGFCDSMGFYPKDMHKYICEHPYPIEAFVHSWLDVNQALIDFGERHKENCKIFRYEDLVNSPKDTITEILGFIGEDFEEKMLEHGLEDFKSIGFGDHKSYQRKQIHGDSIGKWKNLPDYQVHKLAPKLNPMLAYFGYEEIKHTESISILDSREQYARGMEIIAKRNFNSVLSNQDTNKLEQQRSRLSLYGYVTEDRIKHSTNITYQLDTETSNRVFELNENPDLFFSIILLSLLKRVEEEVELEIGLCTIDDKKSNKQDLYATPLRIFPKLGVSFFDLIQVFEPIFQGNVTSLNSTQLSDFDIAIIYRAFNNEFTPDEQVCITSTQALILTITEDNESNFKLNFCFNESVWPDNFLRQKVIEHFMLLLKSALTNYNQSIDSIWLLTEKEEEILFKKNEIFSATPSLVIEKIINQVEQRANHPAVVFEGEELSYQELGMRIANLSVILSSKGVVKDKVVAVCLNRSTNLITALLAVMHAGGTYVPIDPDHPSSRIAQILEDVTPHFIITEKELKTKIEKEFLDKVFYLDNITWNSQLDVGMTPSEPGELAYIIFTSGSTGRPKGVEVRHHGLNTFLMAMAEKPGIDKNDRLLSITTVSFDIAALELFLPLTVGATVYIANRRDTVDGRALQNLLTENQITCFQATPATFHILIANNWQGDSSLKLLCGGEAMPPELARKLLGKCDSLWNMYGPTETTIWSTVKKVEEVLSPMPIGCAIRGTRSYVLNNEFSPVPIGVPGELFIAGDGVAKGYHGRDDLTEERFLSDPFSNNEDATMYKTGDLVKVLGTGDLVYLGRLDNQVKIRGYRIELGDIENTIRKITGVNQCVVGVHEQGASSKSLVAYLVLSTGTTKIDINKLRDYLKALLPEYMIPSFVVHLDALPLTPNNKIDRKALPSPIGVKDSTENNTSSLLSEEKNISVKIGISNKDVEKIIIKNWKKILGIKQVSSEDSFIGLGGDSLSYVQISIDLENTLGFVPENWEVISIRDLAQEKMQSKSSFTEVETTIFIRAAAIVSIVFLHALPEYGIHGNTGGLFIVAGFLFSKFQFEQINSRNSISPVFLSAWRIFLPSTIFMGLWLYLWHNDLRFDVLLLYSNFTNPIATYWFVQVLIQIMFFMALLFAVKPILQFAKKDPFKFGIILLIVSVVLMLFSQLIGPDQGNHRQLPHVRLWQFVIGWCIYYSETNLKRIATAHILCLIAFVQFLLLDRSLGLVDPIVTIFFGILLIAHTKVVILKPLNNLIYGLAGASLFIFLSHRSFFAIVHKYIPYNETRISVLAFFTALLGGYIFWIVWEQTAKYFWKSRGRDREII